jgi:hypothetical protein
MNNAEQANQFARLRSGIASTATQFTVPVAGVFALRLNGSALLNVIPECRRISQPRSSRSQKSPGLALRPNGN